MSAVRFTAAVLLGLAFVASPALARNDVVDFPVETAKANVDQSKLLDIPWFMAGQKHPPVAQSFGAATTRKSTNAVFKADETSCSIAFMSGIIQLQTRARQLGANAVIDIKSHSGNDLLESATTFRCNVGNIVSRVGLTGTPVKLK